MTFFSAVIAKIKTQAAGIFRRLGSSFWRKKQEPLLKLPAPGHTGDTLTKQSEDHPSQEYMSLKMAFRDIGRMNAIGETLGRDFLTHMPEGAYKSRLGQIAFLYRRMHEELANQNIATLIEKAHAHEQKNPEDWDEWDHANLREMEIMYRHHCQVDPDLMERRARLSYEGRRVHRDVLAANDWNTARPFLEDMIDLQRRIAESKCLRDNEHETEAPYQALMREFIPGTRVDDIVKLFGQVETSLKEKLPVILALQEEEDAPLPLTGPFPAAQQMWLNRSLLKVMGFDFNRGGLYETGHNPVEGGTPDDTRLVIKTADTESFLDSMKSALHEGGHGIYIQGLPRDLWRYQPVGQDLGAAIHESQALMIEMILGRTREFFEYLSPRVEGLFQKFGDPAMKADNLYRLKNWVKPGVDRKHADEVTYFFHIQLRTNLERDLIAGRLEVKDLPEAWRQASHELIGEEPTTYADGCLQDVHWFVGKFGYFPSYALGHMIAAQVHERLQKDIQNVPDLMRDGDFLPIRNWLNDKIYQYGRLKRPMALIEDVTGSRPGPAALLRHIDARYMHRGVSA